MNVKFMEALTVKLEVKHLWCVGVAFPAPPTHVCAPHLACSLLARVGKDLSGEQLGCVKPNTVNDP